MKIFFEVQASNSGYNSDEREIDEEEQQREIDDFTDAVEMHYASSYVERDTQGRIIEMVYSKGGESTTLLFRYEEEDGDEYDEG